MSFNAYSQTYKLSTQYTFGGDENDNANDIIETSDNGVIMVGSTNSKNSFDVGESYAYRGNGGSDFLVIKVNSDGSVAWSKTFGGTRDEEATGIARASNGDYVIIGPSRSTDGDANFNGTNGGILMVRLKEDGSFVSKRIVPGGRRFTQDTFHYSNAFSKPTIRIAADGYIYIGGTYEIASSPYKAKQFYLTKLTPTGDTLWEKVFGSDLDDQMGNFIISSTGDIIMVGSTTALNSQILGAGNGNLDFLIIKTTKEGELLWERSWGGDNIDAFHGIIENHQKTGYLVVGETSSSDGLPSSSFGKKDAFFFEIDLEGNTIWSNRFGGDGNDNLFNIIKDGSDKYLAFGTSNSNIKNVQSKGPLTDVLTLNISNSGDIENIGLYGGEDIDVARGGIAINDTTWALAGISRSQSEDVKENKGENDFWLLMLGIPPPIEFAYFKGFTNQHNNGELTWRTNYEMGAEKMRLEKSLDDINFTLLKEFDTSEDYEFLKTYTFQDPLLSFGLNYYRLTFIDKQGKAFSGPSVVIEYKPLSIAPEKSSRDLQVYPNPAFERVIVPQRSSLSQFSLFDMTGKPIEISPFQDSNSLWQIGIKHIKSGSYILKVMDGQEVFDKRIIKF